MIKLPFHALRLALGKMDGPQRYLFSQGVGSLAPSQFTAARINTKPGHKISRPSSLVSFLSL